MSCQIDSTVSVRPSRTSSLIRTIITFPADVTTESTKGICKHPTA